MPVDTTTSTIASPVKLSAGPAACYVSPVPQPRSLLYNGRSPVALVSLELPRFAEKDFVQSRIQSVVVATHPNTSSPESRASTVCVDLEAFPSEGSGSCVSFISVSPVEEDRVSISPVNSDDGDPPDMIVEASWIQPLNRPQTPVNNDLQLVVESPSHYEVPTVPITILALVESSVQLSQIYALSSVPMSPYGILTCDVPGNTA